MAKGKATAKGGNPLRAPLCPFHCRDALWSSVRARLYWKLIFCACFLNGNVIVRAQLHISAEVLRRKESRRKAHTQSSSVRHNSLFFHVGNTPCLNSPTAASRGRDPILLNGRSLQDGNFTRSNDSDEAKCPCIRIR